MGADVKVEVKVEDVLGSFGLGGALRSSSSPQATITTGLVGRAFSSTGISDICFIMSRPDTTRPAMRVR
jgi:hypothetical protein